MRVTELRRAPLSKDLRYEAYCRFLNVEKIKFLSVDVALKIGTPVFSAGYSSADEEYTCTKSRIASVDSKNLTPKFVVHPSSTVSIGSPVFMINNDKDDEDQLYCVGIISSSATGGMKCTRFYDPEYQLCTLDMSEVKLAAKPSTEKVKVRQAFGKFFPDSADGADASHKPGSAGLGSNFA